MARFYRQHDTPYSFASGTGHGLRMVYSTVEEFREGAGEGMDTVSGAEVPCAERIMAEPTDRERVAALQLLPELLSYFERYTLAVQAPLISELEHAFATAREEGRREAVEECAKIVDEVRCEGDGEGGIAGVWRLACLEISQRIRHGEVK